MTDGAVCGRVFNVNAKWFVPLSLLVFAAFIIAAKTYLSSIPRDEEVPHSLALPEPVFAAPTVSEAPVKHVFRPRLRALEPLPAISSAGQPQKYEPWRPQM